MTRRHLAVSTTSVALLLVGLGVVPSPATSSTAPASRPTPKHAPISDVREPSNKPLRVKGTKVTVPTSYQGRVKTGPQSRLAGVTPPVGTVRQWLGRDQFQGFLYRKDYTLRGVGDKIEVWVANDTAFPAGDCRTQVPDSTTVTDAQVADLIEQFDSNIFPLETATFSTPPDRDGTNSQIPPDANGNGGDYTGDGDKTVALIDNVRDANFYDFPANSTYIAGFHSSQFDELFDRNVMTIDAYDWEHRTGANPPDDPTADLCTSRPARPFLYESTFAHEWQHLLHYYTDPFEETWLNEGMSDFAQTLTGYVDASKTVFERGADSHIFCFQGFGSVQTPFNPNPRNCGGPENSLNLWNEGTPAEVLSDYGNAYSLMLYLFDHYGTDLMSRLHRDGELHGLPSVDAALTDEGQDDLYRVIHDFQTSTLVDQVVDGPKGKFQGRPKALVTTPSLNSTVNFADPNVNDNPGAAPNGADYVALEGSGGNLISGNNLRSLSFEGSPTLPPTPLQWTVVNNDPDSPGDPVLWSGNGNNLDSAAITSVTVPSVDPTLRFVAKYGAEFGFDYGYVVVSTDGGKTYTPIAGDKTVAGPLGPALNGTTVGFEPHSYDLSAYAGQTVLLGFRYVSDGGVNEGGLLIDDITIGATSVSDGSTLAPFDSPTEISPTPVSWNLRLVGINEGKATARQLEFDGQGTVTLDREVLGELSPFSRIVAIVAYDEPTELVTQYAPYTLEANGVTQAGGS